MLREFKLGLVLIKERLIEKSSKH